MKESVIMIFLSSHSESNEGSPEENGDGCREIANHNRLFLSIDGLPPTIYKEPKKSRNCLHSVKTQYCFFVNVAIAVWIVGNVFTSRTRC